jgi:two-component system phosphate regulon sensor histidine kinase PhoR
MESGRRLYSMKPTDIKSLVEDAVNAYEPLRERRQVTLDLRVQSTLGVVNCDAGAVKDALVNLLSNAYKYGGEPPVIRVWVRETGGRMHFSVTDNGQGIDRREHRRIFEKFYRIDDRLSREREGSGLGLAIVAHVVRAHGGSIEVDSALGRGSTFTLIFPREARPPAAE